MPSGRKSGEQMLFDACSTGNLERLRALADGDPKILTAEEPPGRTVLHVAVEKGRLEIVRYLTDKKPELVDIAYEERTPLSVAAENGKTDIIRAILDRTPQAIEQKTKAGENILHLMAKHGQHKAFTCTFLAYDLRKLAEKKDQDGNTVLHLSVGGRSIGLVKFILKEQLGRKNARNKKGKTALDIAIEEHDHPEWEQMIAYLRDSHCVTGREITIRGGPGFKKEQLDGTLDTMVVAAVFIATLAFSTLMNPPGGVYQDGSLAGKAILSSHPLFLVFFFFNVAASLTSLLIVVIRSTFVFWRRIAVRHMRRLLTALMVASTLFICVDYVMAAWMIYRPGKLKTPSMVFLCTGVGVTATVITAYHLALKWVTVKREKQRGT